MSRISSKYCEELNNDAPESRGSFTVRHFPAETPRLLFMKGSRVRMLNLGEHGTGNVLQAAKEGRDEECELPSGI